ncbi:DUF3742 family protein [Chitinivorax sp. PXF-14]|uniref:DUF3742 family protein n=1 Tax=Chitinivorax sp. PXF-14 TaxID=3230488 RepID=UPI003467DB9C
MKTAAQTTFAERIGRTLGWAWRGCARLDQRAQGWLHAKGWTPSVAKAALLVVKLAVVGVLLYTTFWLALLLACVIAGAWLLRNGDGSYDEEQKTEWRHGTAGFGLYTANEQRIDPHDPDEDQP